MDKESRSIDITIFRRPAIWMILFGLLHTVGYTMEAMSLINDDDEVSNFIKEDIDPEIADNQKLIDNIQQNELFSWGLGMMWSPILFAGALWLKGSEQAKLSLTFGSAMIGFGILLGYSGVMFDDGFDFGALVFTALFAMPMVITGYLNLEDQS
ncbi:MAG: hypothetical protein VYE32_04430 [Candidatus Thermoplasmatota archaeon]|nr:hypothetical protein [Candidatus Thermoplasmatota archaeon]